MRYKGKVYRPPSEAYSLIVQVTYGCSHNSCAFCDMYDDKHFSMRPMQEIREDFELARRVYHRVERVFLADGDALMRKTDELIEILGLIYGLFPECERVTCYASPTSLQIKSEDDLRLLRARGLRMVYMGLESGCDAVLTRMNKGHDAAAIVAAGQKARRCGLALSVTAISGLGSRELLREHAIGTAQALSAMNPEYVGLLTLMVEPGTPLAKWVREGSFEVLGPVDGAVSPAHRQSRQRLPHEPRVELPDAQGDAQRRPRGAACARTGGAARPRPAPRVHACAVSAERKASMKRKKNKSPQQLYQAARGNLLLMLIFSAVNVAFAAFGVDIYFLFSDYLAYMLALTGRVFLEYTDEGLYLAVGLASAVLVLVPYLLCWIFSKKRRGWMIAALVLFAVDTGALVVDTLGSDDVLYNLPDLLFHIWVLVYLVLGVKHAQQALAPQPEETPATQPLVESTFYDASLGGQPNTPSLGAPQEEWKYRILVTADWNGRHIEVRRSRGLTELVVDGRVYGRTEGIIEREHTISARIDGHDVATVFYPTGRQTIEVDGEVIAKKQRLY